MRRATAFALLSLAIALTGGGPAPAPATAAPEAALTGVAEVRAGSSHSCARLTDGRARCWGHNDRGQLGNGTWEDELLPTAALRADGNGPLTGVAELATGFHTCARLTNGQVRCWGPNSFGELGSGSTSGSEPLPRVVTVPGGARLKGVVGIGAGDGHTCALLANGWVRCWGENDEGQVGDGTNHDRKRAVLVTIPGGGPLTGATQLAVGRHHNCALLRDSRVRCWGSNHDGSVGDGTTVPQRKRARLVIATAGPGFLTNATQVAAGSNTTCAVLRSGQARCWGLNSEGALGDGTAVSRSRPTPVKAASGPGRLTGVTAVSPGAATTCARMDSGQARCWGWNGVGTVGDGTSDDRFRPVPVRNQAGTGRLSGVLTVSTGGSHACARVPGGRAVCWGANWEGQLGNGTDGNQTSLPVVVQT